MTEPRALTGPEIVERFETAYLETIYRDRSDFVLSPQSSLHFLGFKAGILAVLDAIREPSEAMVGDITPWHQARDRTRETIQRYIDALRREITG